MGVEGQTGEADWDEVKQAFYGSRAPGTPSPTLSGRVVRLLAEPRHDCLILGPPNSGKTALLSSFSQASELVDHRDFQAFAQGALADLKEWAHRHRHDSASWAPTSHPATYSLQVTIKTNAVLMQVRDVPGKCFFPFVDTWWNDLTPDERYAFSAPNLVLCIDSLEPQPLWGESLPKILDRLATNPGPPIPRLGSPLPPQDTEYPCLLPPKRQLPFKRVLVALTRIDPLIHEAIQALQNASEILSPLIPRSLKPEELARRIDPVCLVLEQVGPVLGQIRSALAPEAELAVGITSAWGFELEPWVPFGVREALLFLADGCCEGPVTRVEPDSSLQAVSGRWTDITDDFPTNTSGGQR